MQALRQLSFLIAFAFISCGLEAQTINSKKLAVGSGPGQIGLAMALNEECHGPATIGPASEGRLAILDRVNGKIVVLGAESPKDIQMPNDLIEPTDFIATSRGYIVVGAAGDAAIIEENGIVIARNKSEYNAESGSPRLISMQNGSFAIENLQGTQTPINFTQAQTGVPIVKGFATANDYQRRANGSNEITFFSNYLPTVTIKSNIRITSARPIWVDKDIGALIAVQESRRLPQENSFVRLVTSNADGLPVSEAYLNAETFACDTARPYARLTDGKVVSLNFHADNTLSIKVLNFSAIGSAKPTPVAEGLDAVLIASDQGTLEELEKINGSTDAVTISMSSISRSTILDRARKALEYKWLLTSTAYSQADIQNLCSPPENKWTRAKILDGKQGTWRAGLPYAWGSYIADISVFSQRLEKNSLASNVCTCRNANCVNKRAIGVDCSGFVSYAWRIGSYRTTASLPNKNISTPVSWSNIAPGDIVNKKSNHVRLIESVSPGPNGNILTVIESTTLASCGGVCRKSYSQADLQAKGYKPLRRNLLSN